MKLGFLTAILPELALHEVLRIAAEIGYECLEVCCWPPSKAERRYSGITHIDIDQVAGDDGAIAAIRRQLDDHEIEISGLAYYPNLLTPVEAEASTAVAHLRRVVEAAPELGISRVNTFVGRNWKQSVEENWPRFLDTWTPMIDLAAERGVQIGIENCPMIFTADEWPGGKNLASNPAIWRRMFEAIPDPHFGLNYDPSHMIWQHMDYLQPMRDFADRIFHVHAKDVRLDRSRLNQVGIMGHPNDYHSPKLPGLGDVDWGQFFSTLSDVGYQGPVCVEVEDRAYEGSLEDRIRALKQSHRYLSQYVA